MLLAAECRFDILPAVLGSVELLLIFDGIRWGLGSGSRALGFFFGFIQRNVGLELALGAMKHCYKWSLSFLPLSRCQYFGGLNFI